MNHSNQKGTRVRKAMKALANLSSFAGIAHKAIPAAFATRGVSLASDGIGAPSHSPRTTLRLTTARNWGATFVGLFVGLIVLLLVAAATPVASAAPPVLWQAEAGTGAGQIGTARGVAADPGNGHIFVGDQGGRRIVEFDAWGTFVKAWGWDVAAAGDPGDTDPINQFEICTTVCKGGTAGTAGVGQFNIAAGVAVDSSGNIYVVDPPARRAQKFSPAGEFLLMFGGEVNKTTLANVCTKADLEGGDECGAGTTGSAPGQFGAVQALSTLIAITPDDKVYVGDVGRIQRFDMGGVYQDEIALPGENVNALAVDVSGNLYAAYFNASNNNKEDVRKLDPTSATPEVPVLTFPVTNPRAIAVAPNGDAYVFDKATSQIRHFDPGATEVETPFPAPTDLANSSTGLAVNDCGGAEISVYHSNNNPSFLRAYSQPPDPAGLCGAPPARPPTIDAQYAESVGVTKATVKAEINPRFWSDTTYYLQYGTAQCVEGEGGWEEPCVVEQPAPPGETLTGEIVDASLPVTAPLDGLQPGTAYRYRFVAQSGGGGPVFGAGGKPGEDGTEGTFTTFAPPFPKADCPNQVFRTGSSASLPDCRAYEMVSPPDKNSGEVAMPGNAGGAAHQSVMPQQASLDGEALTYGSFTAFGDAQSALAVSQYLSRRTPAGWSTENISPPDRRAFQTGALRGFSPDLSVGAVVQGEPPLAPGAADGFKNLYLRDNLSGALTTVTAVTPVVPTGQNYCLNYSGASAGFDHVILSASGKLTPDAPEAAGNNLYEWSGGELRLVSVLPDGTPAPPSGFSGFGSGAFGCEEQLLNISYRAISADGSRIFWTDRNVDRLYARVNGTETVQLDAPQGGPGNGGGRYWGASADGSRVLFTTNQKLTADATASGGLRDLYQYDLDTGTLIDLTVNTSEPAGVRGVLGVSEDGAYIYFAASGVLDEGATANRNNLYVWHAGETRFIATLGGDPIFACGLVSPDACNWSDRPIEQTARLAPDGGHLAFTSVVSLTGYDNVDQGTGQPAGQVYLYDFQADELVCTSCNPSGARPIGSSSLPAWNTPHEQPRYLSDDDGRLFFESRDALALHDTNGRQDVYQWERPGKGDCEEGSSGFVAGSGGCLSLISSGRSGNDAYLLDASSDGRDVFISTRQRLVAADEDERYDVYDARVGGGFPAVAVATPCSGEACRPGQAPLGALAPASAAFAGEGNLRARRDCGRAGRQARELSRRAGRLAGNAGRVGNKTRAKRMRRKANRLVKRAERLDRQAKRCRRANRRAAR